MKIAQRLDALRQAMSASHLDAYVITGFDPHGSEYPPSRWRTREWISGFTGSAGTVAVTADDAGLWTDYRYWLQAPRELDGSGVRLFHDGRPGTPRVHEWLAGILKPGARIGVDGRTVTVKQAGEWESCFAGANMTLVSSVDLLEDLWTGRPDGGNAPVIELDEDDAGESRAVRIRRLRDALDTAEADTWIGTALDSAAWLLNVRGSDVPYNPVVIGFLLETSGSLRWFTDTSRIGEVLSESLNDDGVQLAPYADFPAALSDIDPSSRVLVDVETVSKAVIDRLPEGVTVRTGKDPIRQMKARKNPVEIARTCRAMEKDGVALVRFLMRLERAVNDGERLTELGAVSALRSFRAQIPGYIGDSFSPIPAFGAHGAIVHYEASEESGAELVPGSNLFLIDSGAQWEEGTTDITRTVALGTPTEHQKRDYTLTLKGHTALARARFPVGTRGYQLDTIARLPLWREGIDYGHGTGHGVGYRLNVHEGPQRLSPAPIDVALEPGMIVSDEPGIYREGEWGVRIENLLLCRNDITTGFGTFLAFDTLSLAPYDRSLIDCSLLTPDEVDWINGYHETVRCRLNPLLEEDEIGWLNRQTAPL